MQSLVAALCLPTAATVAAASSPFSPPGSIVVIASDPRATDAFQPQPAVVQSMLDRALTNLTGCATVKAAWLSLVSTQDVVGIKVFSEPGPNSGTRPAVVAAVVHGLLAAGIPTNHIILWDKRQIDLRLGGYTDLARQLGVRAAGSMESGYDDTNFYATPFLGNLVWGDHEFGHKGENLGRKSFVSMLVSRQMTKIINITPLMNHNEAGVCGNLFSLAMGSVDNTTRFEGDPGRLATAVPEIYALPSLSDRVALSIVDALICQYEGEERSLLHYSAMLNELRLSRDPVALDFLSLQELAHQRLINAAPASRTNMDLIQNAALLELGTADPNRISIHRLPAQAP
ncbi:MAG: DUF362 domain-containing protein [Verrucomicrobiota bacterium]